MEHVRFHKMYGDVGVRMSGQIVFQSQRGVVRVQCVLLGEYRGRNRSRRRGGESVLPTFYARINQEMLARVLLSQDAGARLMYPFVSAGVIEVPVGIDQ